MRKFAKVFIHYIQRRMAEEFGFVLWIPEYRKAHYSMDYEDMREWVLCYPEDVKMFLFRKGELL